MKLLSTNNARLLGTKLIKTLIICAAIIATVILVFSLGSVAGEFFGKLLK